MASAAAVAADQAQSPIDNGREEDYGLAGEVTSGIHRADIDQPDGDVPANDDDSEDGLPANPLRGAKRPQPTVDADEDGDEDGPGGDDLFGDEEDGAADGEQR